MNNIFSSHEPNKNKISVLQIMNRKKINLKFLKWICVSKLYVKFVPLVVQSSEPKKNKNLGVWNSEKFREGTWYGHLNSTLFGSPSILAI